MSDLSRSDLRVVYPPDIKAGVAALRHARAAYGSNEEAVARAVYHAMRNDERADLRAVVDVWLAGSSPDYEAAARGVWERNNDGNWFQHKQLRTGSYLKAKHDAIAAVDAAFPGLFEERPQ